MKRIVTSKDIRMLEERTINEIGVPSLCLMERASYAVSENIYTDKSVLIMAGTGNNGADGLAVSRILFLRGADVTVCLIGDRHKASPDNIKQLEICRKLNIVFASPEQIMSASYDYIIDAIFGIGLSRDISGEYLDAVNYINESRNKGSRIISIDIPSGLCSDRGLPLGSCVAADKTVTFEWAKPGHLLNKGPLYSGELIVSPIGIIRDALLSSSAFTYDREDLTYIPERNILGNKGTFGKVLCICGSDNMPGAALLCAKSVLKSGAGMVRIVSASSNKNLIIGQFPEAMFASYDDINENELKSLFDWCDICIIGPGLSVCDKSRELTKMTILGCAKKLIADADALNILSEDMTLLEKRSQLGYETAITPHPGEFARLFGHEISDKMNQSIPYVREVAEKYGIIVLAKDARSIICDKNRIYINSESSSALATAGSGDVLTGIIAALGCIFPDLFEACTYATLVHSMAGIEASHAYGVRSVTAGDVIDSISAILK